jgi:hypothetical protein
LLLAQPASARRSLQSASSGRASSPWSTRPGRQPWRRWTVRIQHAVSTIRCRRPGSGCPAVRCPAIRCPAIRCPAIRCPAIRCPAIRCPVAWGRRPGSGVRPAAVHPSSRLVSTRPASSRLLSTPVRPDASPPTPGGGVGDQTGAAGPPSPQERGEVPVGCRAVGRPGRRPSRPGRATLPRSHVGQWRVGGGPGPVGEAAAALDRLSDQAGQGGVQSARGWRLRCGHGSRLQREVAALAAWLPSRAGCAATVCGHCGA